MTSVGKSVRLKRIFSHPSGRVVTVAMDHGISHGPALAKGLDAPESTLARLVAGHPSAVTLHRGLARRLWSHHAGQVPLIMQTSIFTPGIEYATYEIASVKEALRLGADAVAMAAHLLGQGQRESLKELGRLIEEAWDVGLPVVAHLYPMGELVPPDQRYAPVNVIHCARVGAEMGVDVVKTLYPGDVDAFKRVVESCPVPVVAAGGPRAETLEDILRMAEGVREAGAAGITFGRNVWMDPRPEDCIRALKRVMLESWPCQEAAGEYWRGREMGDRR